MSAGVERLKARTVVVGSGPGGATVARGLAQAGQEVLVLERGGYHKPLTRWRTMVRMLDHMGMLASVEGTFMVRLLTVGGSSIAFCGIALEPPGLAQGTARHRPGAVRRRDQEGAGSRSAARPACRRGSGPHPAGGTGGGPRLESSAEVPQPRAVRPVVPEVLGRLREGRQVERARLRRRGGRPRGPLDDQGQSRQGALRRRPGDRRERNRPVGAVRGRSRDCGARRRWHRHGGHHAGVGVQGRRPGLLHRSAATDHRHLARAGIVSRPAHELRLHRSQGRGVHHDRRDRPVAAVLHGTRPRRSARPALLPALPPHAQHHDQGPGPSERHHLSRRHSVQTSRESRSLVRSHEARRLPRQILKRAGCDMSSVVLSPPRGAHPGGTVRIGDMLDNDLQTSVAGLYVCDSSAHPRTVRVAPGAHDRGLRQRLLERSADAPSGSWPDARTATASLLGRIAVVDAARVEEDLAGRAG